MGSRTCLHTLGMRRHCMHAVFLNKNTRLHKSSKRYNKHRKNVSQRNKVAPDRHSTLQNEGLTSMAYILAAYHTTFWETLLLAENDRPFEQSQWVLMYAFVIGFLHHAPRSTTSETIMGI